MKVLAGRFMALVTTGMLWLMTSQIAEAQQRPLGLEDVLKMESLGTGIADPTGRWFVYEHLRPYDEIGDYSFRTYAFGGKSGHQLWRYDLSRGGPPELLPGLDQEPFSWQQGFSPSGRFLAVLQYRLGRLTFGAYDMGTAQAVWFDPVPAFAKTGEHGPVWVSEHEIVYAALPQGEYPRLTSARAHTGAVLTQAWKDAWRGDVVTASEVRSQPEADAAFPIAGQLILGDVKTGETRVLAQSLFADLRLSPGGQYLAGLEVLQAPARAGDGSFDLEARHYRLRVLDLTAGEDIALAPGKTFFPYTLTWSPDGQKLAGFSWPEAGSPSEGRFRVFGIHSGQMDVFEHRGLELASERERGWLQRPERAVFLGPDLAVFARPHPEGPDAEPLFSNQDFMDRTLPAADWYAINASGSVKALTEGLEGVSGVPVDGGTGHMTVLASDGAWRLYAGGRREKLTPDIPGRWTFLPSGNFATHASVARPEFSANAVFTVSGTKGRTLLAISLEDGPSPQSVRIDVPSEGDVLTVSLPGGALLISSPDRLSSRLRVFRPDSAVEDIAWLNAHLQAVDPGVWQGVAYEFKARDGAGAPRRVESCVLLPPDHRPGTRLPLIVEVYPDVRSGCREGPPTSLGQVRPVSAYLWAGTGYAYVRVSAPLDLMRTPEGPLAGLAGLIDAGTLALREAGIADPDRLALYGFSQGGVSALSVAAHTQENFRGVIAMNSWADLFSDYFGPLGIYSYVYGERFGANSLRYDLTIGSEFGMGRSAFEAPDLYYRNSPVFLAREIDMPVLLIHSDMDAFPMSQFDGMYGALRRAGKDVRYVRYWGEGHAPSSPANIRDLWQRWEHFLQDQGVSPRTPGILPD